MTHGGILTLAKLAALIGQRDDKSYMVRIILGLIEGRVQRLDGAPLDDLMARARDLLWVGMVLHLAPAEILRASREDRDSALGAVVAEAERTLRLTALAAAIDGMTDAQALAAAPTPPHMH